MVGHGKRQNGSQCLGLRCQGCWRSNFFEKSRIFCHRRSFWCTPIKRPSAAFIACCCNFSHGAHGHFLLFAKKDVSLQKCTPTDLSCGAMAALGTKHRHLLPHRRQHLAPYLLLLMIILAKNAASERNIRQRKNDNELFLN